MANSPNTRFEWSIHHPFGSDESDESQQGNTVKVCVKVRPKKGLLPRWRFVVPADYTDILEWGTINTDADTDTVKTNLRGKVGGGPLKLLNGPEVRWMGAIEPISSDTYACIVFKGKPPDYIMFGQGDTPSAPPGALEGINFVEPNN